MVRADVVEIPVLRAKLAAMRAWVEGVNSKGGFGVWASDVAYEMATIQDILAAHGA